MKLRAAWLCAVLAGCTVPSIGELGTKKCGGDGGRECVLGYVCVGGNCVASGGGDGGPCSDGDSRSCGSSIGECRIGTQHCANGVFGACEGEVGPGTETCNGKDDDCDGTPDDNLANVPACEKDAGVCANATRACIDGGFEVTCSALSYGVKYQPVELSCDGFDNDCDGIADNSGVSGGPCLDAGVCGGYSLLCTGGVPGVCPAPGFEAVEASCDGKDNDCDGLVDEGLVGPGACQKDAGVCAGKRPACVDGGFELICTAQSYGADFEAVESKCDGLDNDCDGKTDRLGDGGLLPILPKQDCEKTLGVCGNAGRSCVGGQPEAPCTAASYGPLYVPFDGVCDGVDNDCDGQPDRSVEAAVVTSANAITGHLSWVAGVAPAAYGAAYVDERGGVQQVFFRAFNTQLKPAGNELLLSAASATKSSKPAIARAGADYVVLWLEETATTKALVLARVSGATHTQLWRQVPVASVTLLGDPRVAANTLGTQLFVVWVDGATASLRGLSRDDLGAPLSGPAVLSGKLPDGGFSEQVFDCDVLDTASPFDFVVGWSSFSNGSGGASARAFNAALAPTSTLQVHGPVGGETVRNTRVVRTATATGGTTGVGLAWVGVAASEEHVRFSPESTAATPGVVVAAAGSIPDLSAGVGAGGPIAVWVQGIVGSRLVVARLRADAGVAELAGDAGAVFAPALASTAGGFALGYESDRGQGLDLYGQVGCSP